MHKVKKVIVDSIQLVLRQHGFEKDGSTWFKENGGVLAMIALIQSQHGFQTFRLQIGLHVRSLANPNTTFSKKGVPEAAIGAWHLIGPLDRKNTELETALNGEIEVADDTRRHAVIEALEEKALPILTDFRTKDGISKYLADEGDLVVTRYLRDWVAI